MAAGHDRHGQQTSARAYGPLGPVAVFGPNNFPLAFNGISGGDFAAAIAAGNPVIAKAHPSHPRTSQLLAEQAHERPSATGLPAGTVQLLYKMPRREGERLVSDPRLGCGWRSPAAVPAGWRLKGGCRRGRQSRSTSKCRASTRCSSCRARFDERRAELVDELAGSCLLGTGQFCTCPNLFVLLRRRRSGVVSCRAEVAIRIAAGRTAALGTRARNTAQYRSSRCSRPVPSWSPAAARPTRPVFGFENTLLRVSGDRFLQTPGELQTEAFGNATLAVVVDSGLEQARQVAPAFGRQPHRFNLLGDATARMIALYDLRLRRSSAARVGRLLNDKMPTGVAVSPAMNHGGPFPATGHPGFTAVGIPASMRRFAMLECYDNVRPDRLPPWLRDAVAEWEHRGDSSTVNGRSRRSPKLDRKRSEL